jgi:hypothetical protein
MEALDSDLESIDVPQSPFAHPVRRSTACAERMRKQQ